MKLQRTTCWLSPMFLCKVSCTSLLLAAKILTGSEKNMDALKLASTFAEGSHIDKQERHVCGSI